MYHVSDNAMQRTACITRLSVYCIQNDTSSHVRRGLLQLQRYNTHLALSSIALEYCITGYRHSTSGVTSGYATG